MATIFALLLLLSVGLLIGGVIAPQKLASVANKSMSRKEAALGFGGLSVLFFFLTGMTATPQNSIDTQSGEQVKSVIDEKPAAQEAPKPVISTVTDTQAVAFETQTVNDPNMTRGTTKVTTVGVKGVKTFTYEITTLEGKETGRKLIKEEITTQPVSQVTSIGTKAPAPAPTSPPRQSSNCSPNYSGCVPIASDVDCAGGSGNGPAYVRGPVNVIGADIYDLDRDGDGIACE